MVETIRTPSDDPDKGFEDMLKAVHTAPRFWLDAICDKAQKLVTLWSQNEGAENPEVWKEHCLALISKLKSRNSPTSHSCDLRDCLSGVLDTLAELEGWTDALPFSRTVSDLNSTKYPLPGVHEPLLISLLLLVFGSSDNKHRTSWRIDRAGHLQLTVESPLAVEISQMTWPEQRISFTTDGKVTILHLMAS